MTTNTLTKSFYLSLRPETYLVSNVGLAPGQPAFAETVFASKSDRAEQWRRIVLKRANRRKCTVYPDALSFQKSALEMSYVRNRN